MTSDRRLESGKRRIARGGRGGRDGDKGSASPRTGDHEDAAKTTAMMMMTRIGWRTSVSASLASDGKDCGDWGLGRVISNDVHSDSIPLTFQMQSLFPIPSSPPFACLLLRLPLSANGFSRRRHTRTHRDGDRRREVRSWLKVSKEEKSRRRKESSPPDSSPSLN